MLNAIKSHFHSGLVYSEVKRDSINQAKLWIEELKRERETYSRGVPYPWLLAKMRQIGLETHTQNFTLRYPFGGGKTFTGKNVYGILRAPRIGSTEAIVISCPYRYPESIHTDISHGVALMLAFADFARSKTVIFEFDVKIIKTFSFRTKILGKRYHLFDHRSRAARHAGLVRRLLWT